MPRPMGLRLTLQIALPNLAPVTTQPARINFRFYPDASFVETTTLRDSDGAAVDLTGKTARMQIRRDRDDTEALFELTTENGGIALGVDGSITLTIAAGDTYPSLTPAIDRDGEMWWHDLLLSTPGTPVTVERLYQGNIFVFPGVTKPA